ncbi:hypothetical protein, partial [Achromobacter xylosoxidans]|uniref:hypothetical protein n=1 Tax=Alcaligenes xylosoxydans xylosoxydans TaxID=85698 RepID=UPI001A94019A
APGLHVQVTGIDTRHAVDPRAADPAAGVRLRRGFQIDIAPGAQRDLVTESEPLFAPSAGVR